jgi:ferredoxin
MKRYIPQVDTQECLGHGDCAQLAPEVFRVDEVATVIGEGHPEVVLEAARVCPACAILVFDAETGEQVYP